MKQFNITGMSCAACSARVEKAVCALDGIESCSVNMLTNLMGVEGTASEAEIISAVQTAGYGASVKGTANGSENMKGTSLSDTETSKIKYRLICSLIFLAILMYFSMGHTMLNLPIPEFLHGNYLASGLIQLILSAIVMVINQNFFINGFKGLMHRTPNMDTLVALGSSASFVYSMCVLFTMTDSYVISNAILAKEKLHGLYFESAAMILTLITVGKMLESRAKGKTTNALKKLMELAPQTATLLVDGQEVTVPVEKVKVGDIFILRPGESVPVDGVVLKGTSAVNESSLTGESIPADKKEGDSVSAATINLSGYLECRATRVGEDTSLALIIKTVSDASATKAPIAKIADKVSSFFVPIVIIIATITTAIWLILGETIGFALARGVSVLVISCPCALGLATPVAIMVSSGIGAKNGILFKTAASLEHAGKATTVVLDKTGTITKGEPQITDILLNEDINKSKLLDIAYSLEKNSEHPLAKAVINGIADSAVNKYEVENFEVFPGNGLKAVIDGKQAIGGNRSFIEANTGISDEIIAKSEVFADEGKTPLFFAYDGNLLGVIAVADVIKEDSKEAIAQLKNMGIHTVMLTGDNKKTAMSIGKAVGVDEIISDVLPGDKEAVIRNFRQIGNVIMVGDGINDAPALTSADTGIAIGAGTDIAIDSADVVLVNSILSGVSAAIRLSRATLKNIKENLFWAFIYNIIGIPLAAGNYIPLFGWELNPMFGAAAMSLSSICVVSNALRLNLKNIHNSKYDKKVNTGKSLKKEKKQMEKIMKIEGMMCPHCEARVKKVLEEIDGVTEVIPSHADGTATVKTEKMISDEILKKTVEDQGYKVLAIDN